MKKLRITVGKKTYDVTVEVLSDDDPARSRPVVARQPASAAPSSPPSAAPASPATPRPPAPAGAVTSPMAGTVKSVKVKDGDAVKENQILLTLDAMKMEVPVSAPVAGTVASVEVKEGQAVQEGQALVVLH